MPSPLRLDRFILNEIHFVPAAFEKGPESELSERLPFKVEAEHAAASNNPRAHQLVVTVRFGEDAEPQESGPEAKPYPYSGRISGRAFFEVGAGPSDDEALRLAIMNGSAITLGMLRSHLLQLTQASAWKPILIPVVNLYQEFSGDENLAKEDEADE